MSETTKKDDVLTDEMVAKAKKVEDIPTLPVTSCGVESICPPTCIPFICDTETKDQGDAQVSNSIFPPTCIPVICQSQGSPTGLTLPPFCSVTQAPGCPNTILPPTCPFPTLPPNCHVTTLLPGCQSHGGGGYGQHAGYQQAGGGYGQHAGVSGGPVPTVFPFCPVTLPPQCPVPTLPPVCPIPTLPPQCPVTVSPVCPVTLPPVCFTHGATFAGSAAATSIPTLPATSCGVTSVCPPTCIPFVC